MNGGFEVIKLLSLFSLTAQKLKKPKKVLRISTSSDGCVELEGSISLGGRIESRKARERRVCIVEEAAEGREANDKISFCSCCSSLEWSVSLVTQESWKRLRLTGG